MDSASKRLQRQAMQASLLQIGLPMFASTGQSRNSADMPVEGQGQDFDFGEKETGQFRSRRSVRFDDTIYTPSQSRRLLAAGADGSSDTRAPSPRASTPEPSPSPSSLTPDDRMPMPRISHGLLDAVSPGSMRRKKDHIRFQETHPFVIGTVRHKQPGEVHRKKYTQYVYSVTNTDFRITHHFLCETSDLERPVYYYHDVGGYTRLDPDHRFTLHLGNHSGAPILGGMWHGSAGMYFAVGNPFMDLGDMYDESVKTIERQYCEYLKPISSAPTRWHMDFTFGGGADEGPLKSYRWQVAHLSEAIVHLRHGKLELRERDGHETVDAKGKKKDKSKLLAACRNVDELGTNLWVRDPPGEMGSELARLKWKSWVLLTWGAMRDRMRGPHNTGSPHHDVGYTKSTRTVQTSGGLLRSCITPATSEEIRERSLHGDEY